MTESTRPRLQKATDVQEVKLQSLDTNAPASYTASGTSRFSRTRVAVFVALIIFLLVLAVCRILMCYSTASSPSGSKPSSNTSEEAPGYSTASSPPESKPSSDTSEEAPGTGLDPRCSGENGKQNHTGCPPDWERHGGKCYFFSQGEERKDWNASRKQCIDMKSDLVIIDNQCELIYLLSRSDQYYFLGLTYSESDKKWKWINNMELSTDMFNIERKYSDHFCAVVGHGEVATESCKGSTTTRYMCEKAAHI